MREVKRRAVVIGTIVSSAAIMAPVFEAPMASPLEASQALGPDGSALTGVDVRNIAKLLNGTSISLADSEKIAQSAASILGPLGYLRLLKTAEVRATFDFSALVEDAMGAKP